MAAERRSGDLVALGRDPAPDAWQGLSGRYRSNFWGIEAELRVHEGALVLEVDDTKSCLEQVDRARFHAHDGYFGGFELTFEVGEDGKAPQFSGGVYPYSFRRYADAIPAAERVIDERANLVGRWSGTVSSPLGPVPVSLEVGDAASARATVLSAHDAPVEALSAERGRVSGEFDVALPNLGDFRVFLRLHAAGGKLRGKVYARGAFGEVPMPTELAREA